MMMMIMMMCRANKCASDSNGVGSWTNIGPVLQLRRWRAAWRVQCSCRVPVEEGSSSPDPRQGPVQVSLLYPGGRRRLHVGVDGRHARSPGQRRLRPPDRSRQRRPARLRRLPVQVVELRHRDRCVAQCRLPQILRRQQWRRQMADAVTDE